MPATITGNVKDITGGYRIGRIKFDSAGDEPLSQSPSLVIRGEKTVNTNSSGNFSVALMMGDYTVTVGRDSFTISVPDSSGSYDWLTLITDDVIYDPTAVGTFALLRANNLSDLNNIATARTNLDVYSKAQSDAISYTDAKVDTRITSTWRGMANGLASLDASGLVPTSQLPPLAINETFTPANQAAMLALTAQRGDMAIRIDNGKSYVLSSDSPSTLADWKEITAAGSVVSVNGQTGTVSLTTSNITEGSNLYYTDARARAALSISSGVLLIQAAGFDVMQWLENNTNNGAELQFSATDIYYNGRSAGFLYINGSGLLSSQTTTSLLTEGANLFYTDARVRACLLTGFSANNSNIVAGDSVLVGFNKAQGQLNNKAALSHTHAASDITSGVLALARGGLNADTSAAAQGDILYYNSGWQRLAKGTNGQFLQIGAAVPIWATVTPSQWTTNGSNIYFNTGNVGIGTTTPSFKLHILENANDATTAFAQIQNNNTGASVQAGLNLLSGDLSGSLVITAASTSYFNGARGMFISCGGGIGLTVDVNPNLYIASIGYVGIQTSNPSQSLHLVGTMRIDSGDSFHDLTTSGEDLFIGNGTGYGFKVGSADGITELGHSGESVQTLSDFSGRTLTIQNRGSVDDAGIHFLVQAGRSAIGDGGVTEASINSAGTGYQEGDQLTLLLGNSDCLVRVTGIDGGGGITAFEIDDPGTGYTNDVGGATSTDGGTGAGVEFTILAVNSPTNINGGDLFLRGGKAFGNGTSRVFIHTYGDTVVEPYADQGLNEIFQAIGQRISWFGATPVARPDTYVRSNVTELRTFDADSITINELADVLGTVISDIHNYGLFQMEDTV